MNDILTSSIVRIWTTGDDDGTVVGAGFLVGKRHVLSCAHVVAQALGLPDDTIESPQQKIWLDFPLLPTHIRFAATIILWHPLLLDGGGDIAGLELTDDPPFQAQEANLVIVKNVWQHPFSAFGFPGQQDNGVWATGQLMERQAMGWIMTESVKAQGYSIEQGFSGTPVWDMQAQGAIGMVVAATQPRELRTAFVIPADMLLEAWPEIAALKEDPRNPYKGLRPFKVDDTKDFFGRGQLITEIIQATNTLVQSTQHDIGSSRLLTILGPSGSGKSSVIMAGVWPRLQQGTITDSASWIYLDPLVPGKHPLEALTLTIASHYPDRSMKTIREDIDDPNNRGIYLLTTLMPRQQNSRVILFIDQFEELFTQVDSEEERQHFINLLLSAIDEPRSPLLVFLAMRADFYDRPMQYPGLAQSMQKLQFLMLAMDIADLRTVIEGPAALKDVQLRFDNGLVDDLLFEIRGQPGALPLLQFTLDQLFLHRRGHQLTLQAYREIGGVKGALTKHAEDVYSALPSTEYRRLTRFLFIRLIDPGATEQDTTRRRATFDEFVLVDPLQTHYLQETITTFIKERLLTSNTVAGVVTLEVSHEALIREWTRLSNWVRDAREDIPLQQAISKDASTWERLDKQKDRLYSGSQLREANSWAKRNIPSRQESLFLHASRTQRSKQIIYVISMLLACIIIATSGLQLVAFLHPSWCPSFLCQAPQPLLQQGSVHDSNLEVSFHAIQSSWHTFSGVPDHYNLTNLPRSVDAQLVNRGLSEPYRIVLGVHSLQRGKFGVIIEHVIAVITQTNPVPYPLRVWHESATINYLNNPYQTKYRGEDAGAILSAVSVNPAGLGNMQLVPGEADEITLEVQSREIAEIHLQVRIQYRVMNEAQTHTLTFLKKFDVIFSDAKNWHPYELINGHLIAQAKK